MTPRSNTRICYVHGECRDRGYDSKSCNLVLGIDEYLTSERRDDDNRYAIFKKFIQRIRYHNSSEYFNWQNEMEQQYNSILHAAGGVNNVSDIPEEAFSDVYVFGHSLDVTDKDILMKFLKPGYTRVHVYARDEVDEGRLATKLIKIMSEDTMIQKSGARQMLTFERL